MPALEIFLAFDDKYGEIAERHGLPKDVLPARGDMLAIGTLSNGMTSGKPSVGIVAKLDDGTAVYLETSLVLLQNAARVFTARFGDVSRVGDSGGKPDA